MSVPNKYQLILLGEAVNHLVEEDFSPYLKLKRLFTERPKGFQILFRQIFESYYVLNAAGVTNDFKDRYFELLFGLQIQDEDPYTPILLELYDFPRRKGDRALQCSFVSKLVAIHDESYPIYDKHVSGFFGFTVPSCGSVEFRIAGFVANLKRLRDTYQCWEEDSRFQGILSQVKQKYPRLENCATCRIADLLVWTIGRKKLGAQVGGVII